jgi:heparosan-N-sulfate-glucuronate 5-epimerase
MIKERKIESRKQIFIILGLSLGILFSILISAGDIFRSAYSISIKLDNSSVPLLDYGNMKGGIHVGLQRNPLTTIQYALEFYDLFIKTADQKYREAFLNNTDWLIDNAVSHGIVMSVPVPVLADREYSLLEYNFPWPPYNLEPPWRSGMAQGQALQALIKAHNITGEEKYLDTAKMILNSFFVEIKDGGVTYKTPQNGWWYEEFAGNRDNGPKVLNGMMFAVFGIYDYYNYTKDKDAKYLFDQGVLSLKKNLWRYDHNGTYSAYDVYGGYAPLRYHKIHVDSLNRLYDITKEQIFRVYHDGWQTYKVPSQVHLKA